MGTVDVVLDIFADYSSEMSTTEDEHPVKTLTSDGTDDTLREVLGPVEPGSE